MHVFTLQIFRNYTTGYLAMQISSGVFVHTNSPVDVMHTLNTPGKRLKFFRDVVYDRKWKFGADLEMDAGSMSRYFRDQSMLGGEKLILLHRIGCSIWWYLTGEGTWYADNERGHELADRYRLKFPPSVKQQP